MGVFAGPQLIISSHLIEGNVFKNILNANFQSWLIVIYLGLFMNALGYSIWYYVLGKYPVQKILPVMLLLPITGVLTSILFLGEKPDIKVFTGGLIIILGVGLILFEKIKLNRRYH